VAPKQNKKRAAAAPVVIDVDKNDDNEIGPFQLHRVVTKALKAEDVSSVAELETGPFTRKR